MRRRQGLVLMLLTGLLAGCVTEPQERPSSWLTRLRPLHATTNSRVVQMDVALIERPVGDAYLNKELWDRVDEQVVLRVNEQVFSHEHKALLADHGFRMGVIGGLPPAGLQALLTSDRSCANPRRVQRLAGDPTTLLLGLTMPHCRFQRPGGDEEDMVELEQAQYTLVVTPGLSSDGRTRLQFTPQIRHGQSALIPRPAVDRSGTYSWMLQEQRPTETYSRLSWEVTLSPNEYIVVGGRMEHSPTLGHQCFIRTDEPNPVQRLLVIRATRPAPGAEPDDNEPPSRTVPLALQAAMSGSKE